MESDEPEVQQSIFRFNKKKNNNTMKKGLIDESEIIDGRLKKMNEPYLNKISKRENQEETEKNYKKKMDIDSFYNSYADHDTLPRYRLPSVPSVIKVA